MSKEIQKLQGGEDIDPEDFLPHKGDKLFYGFIKWRGIWDERLHFDKDEYWGSDLLEISDLYNNHILPYCKKILQENIARKIS